MNLSVRVYVLFFILVISIVLISIPNIKQGFSFQKQNKNLIIIFLYPVNQGQGTLLILPNGKTMMIDMGPISLGNKIIETMKKYNLTKIDNIISSHRHPDHTTGIINVINKNITIGKIYDSGIPSISSSIKDYMALVKQKKIPFIQIKEDDKINIDSKIKIEILNPPSPPIDGGDEVSNNSIVVKLTYGNFSILFPGDIYGIVEEQLLGKKLNSDVLLLPHHGNKEASSKGFLKATSPDIAIVSTSKDNPYGYPHAEVINRLNDLGIPLFGLNVYGTLTLVTDGNNFEINDENSTMIYNSCNCTNQILIK